MGIIVNPSHSSLEFIAHNLRSKHGSSPARLDDLGHSSNKIIIFKIVKPIGTEPMAIKQITRKALVILARTNV